MNFIMKIETLTIQVDISQPLTLNGWITTIFPVNQQKFHNLYIILVNLVLNLGQSEGNLAQFTWNLYQSQDNLWKF